MSDTVIREGFLCPICMTDLGALSQLQQHFEEAHSTEDKDVLDQLKGLFGKAKRKLLGQDSGEEDVFGAYGGEMMPAPDDTTPSQYTATGYNPSVWEPQELGATRMLTIDFKRVRDARLDRYVVETNKLVIRLDKLLSPEAPVEPGKRKAYEKSVVPWAPDSDVNLCTTCGKSFNITRRRHHCRLCGGVMCNKCSQFMPFSYAKKMINPSFRYEGEGFRRSSSNSSLNSILSPEGEPHLRTCVLCRNLLERRDQQIEQRTSKPMITQLYEKMRGYLEEGDQLLPEFLKMAESLCAGETTYNLFDAQQLRGKIMKYYESVDVISKRIAKLGLNDPELPSNRTLQLQKSIAVSVNSYLQQNLLGLQALPSEQELVQLQEARQLEAQRRLEEERRLAAEREAKRKQQEAIESARKMSNMSYMKQREKSDKKEVVSSGWKPMEVSGKGGGEDDPMIQQMNIIRGYIKQAKQAQKWDEVQMLEDNLRDLQQEFWRQNDPAKSPT